MAKKVKLTQDEFYKIAGEFNNYCQALFKDNGISFLGTIACELDSGETATANITACAGNMYEHIAQELIEAISEKLK